MQTNHEPPYEKVKLLLNGMTFVLQVSASERTLWFGDSPRCGIGDGRP